MNKYIYILYILRNIVNKKKIIIKLKITIKIKKEKKRKL